MSRISPEVIREHGLNEEEFAKIVGLLGREPNMVELGVFSVMWSEHCSYKSTRAHLKKLPTKGERVIHGPGENAGVVDIGDGDCVVFKMESHNHPSFIEPYQGAATGVGGILRDVFTMGARPVAMLDSLRFGDPSHPKTRSLISGVVSGIGGYGNCMGIPTVAGETSFDKSYDGNILVNAMCVGVAKTDNIFLSAARGVGNPIVYVGSKTGRDGIHGATMASAEFNADSEEKRPTVQVGDPFTEKLVLEACLELMQSDAIIAIQDMGAAGLTSSSCEMADKGGVGAEINLDKVPQRERNMNAYDMMLSESQERMLAVLKPGHEAEAEKIFKKWQLDFSVIGVTTEGHRLILRHKGEVVADMPVHSLSDAAPVYERPVKKRAPYSGTPDFDASRPVMASLEKMIACPDLASKRWIWEQYDSSVMADTVQHEGGDAAVVRVHGTNKALAMCVDAAPRYCKADSFVGGMQAVVETWRNLTAVGATPLAITDNLNFGNPEKPEIMGEIVSAIDGIGEACRALDYPVVSGNCSLYNETQGEGILPTPTIGGVGLMKDVTRMATVAFKREGDEILMLGEKKGHLGQSIYVREIEGLSGEKAGACPPIDLKAEKKTGDFLRELITAGVIDTAHDISDGGLAVAVAEMAMAGNKGAKISLPDGADAIPFLFGEDQGCYLIAAPADVAADIVSDAASHDIAVQTLGTVAGETLKIEGQGEVTVEDLKHGHEAWLPGYMAG